MNTNEMQACLHLMGYTRYQIDDEEITWSNDKWVIHIINGYKVYLWEKSSKTYAGGIHSDQCYTDYKELLIEFLTVN